jgi:HEAT repeat protein
VAAGLETTIATLSKSRNDAATGLLLATLETAQGEIFDATLRGLLTRRSKAGHLAVLRRWPDLTGTQRELLEVGRGRIGGALRDALLSDEEVLFQTACEIAEKFAEFDLIATLVNVGENPKCAHADDAVGLIARLTDQLSEMLREPTTSEDRRDPERLRQSALDGLERSVERFRQHQRHELVEAYVILAGGQDPNVRSILKSPHHPCFQVIVHALATSPNQGVIDLVVSMITSKSAPQVIRNVVSKRTDAPFVRSLLAIELDDKDTPTLANLAKIQHFNWLEPLRTFSDRLNTSEQVTAIRIANASGMKTDDRLDLAEGVLQTGEPEARAAVMGLLEHVTGDRANQLFHVGLNDPSPLVQAAAALPLRERHVPGVMGRLIELVDSPSPQVQEAARGALCEFSLENFMARFESLEETVRRSTGQIVLRVDLTAIDQLRSQLQSVNGRVVLKAIKAAEGMGALPQVSDILVELLSHNDHLIRAAVAEALQHCTGSDVREALLVSLGDRSASVKNAALESLQRLGVESSVIEAAAVAAAQEETR